MNSNAERDLRERAKNIIRNYSIASGTASGALAIGALLGLDTTFSIPMVIRMITELGQLFGLTMDDVKPTDQFKTLIGRFIAVSLSKSILSLVPVIGNVANGLTTYYLFQSVGWAAYEVFKDGKDFSTLTEKEIQAYLKRAEESKAEH